MAQGAVSQSLPIVTAYDTLGEEGLTHSLEETGAVAIFLDGHLIKSIIKPLSKVSSIKVHSSVTSLIVVHHLQR
jgi:long-chain acyl-CoA synthetase